MANDGADFAVVVTEDCWTGQTGVRYPIEVNEKNRLF
jgi:hypothetical protein